MGQRLPKVLNNTNPCTCGASATDPVILKPTNWWFVGEICRTVQLWPLTAINGIITPLTKVIYEHIIINPKIYVLVEP
jgi:hypothetical protein